MRVEEFDVLIIGAGLSGLRAGLELSKKWNAAVISKVFPVRSSLCAIEFTLKVSC